MTRIEIGQAQTEVDSLRRSRIIKRRLRNDPYLDFRPYGGEILGWARCRGASKTVVQELVNHSFKISVSKDRLYRFVVAELGAWPNGRMAKIKGR